MSDRQPSFDARMNVASPAASRAATGAPMAGPAAGDDGLALWNVRLLGG